MGQSTEFVAFFDDFLYNCWHRVLKGIFTKFAMPNEGYFSKIQGNKYNAKKEKRITGGIPEEESGEIQNKIETKGRAGEIEPSPQEKVICEQLRAA